MTTKTNKKDAVAKKEVAEVEFVPLGANDKIRLSAAMVREFVAVPTKSGKLPSERDCVRFIMLCSGKRANPFEGDCFMIGYDIQGGGANFSIVCGLELFTKRAEQSEFYDGIESGIFLNDASDNFAERQGTLLLPGETLLGGWAKIYRKDRARPEYKTVNFATYDTGRSRWQKDPAGMIEKVARSQGLRAAYPTPLGGLYIQEEMERLTEAAENLALEPKDPIIMPTLKTEEAEPVIEAEPPPAEDEQLGDYDDKNRSQHVAFAIAELNQQKSTKGIQSIVDKYPQFADDARFQKAIQQVEANIRATSETAQEQL